jgi:hypothetical protein
VLGGALLLLFVLGAIVAATLAVARGIGRWALPLTWLAATLLSTALYLLPTAVDGRNAFHERLALALLASCVLAWEASRRAGPSASQGLAVLVAAVGTLTPPAILVALVEIACPGGGCWS